MEYKMKKLFFLLLISLFSFAYSSPEPTALYLQGYTILPTPRNVTLHNGAVQFDESWSLQVENVDKNDIAVRFLLNDLRQMHGLVLNEKKKTNRILMLSVQTNTVKTAAEPMIDAQAYRLDIMENKITIIGNAPVGLFYGVQTFLQLLGKNPRGAFVLPQCTITDWPSLALRIIHWDTKHHQDRMETLKRYLDWAARFKINAIGWELEDKFAYPSHPVIGAPGAFTPEQIQEIVDYGLERHIQVIPQVQAPAHMAYVLKHPEFAHLRSDGSNYQACLCDEETYKLIFSMYEDLIKATQGVKYFFVSTDEVYYAGICEKCKRPYNPVNRSLAWVEFANRAHDFLAQHGRQMLCWAEYPLLTEHVKLLPEGIIDGIIGGGEDFIHEEAKRNIRQLAYVSMQGAEKLFPNLFPYVKGGRPFEGRLQSAFQTLSYGKAWKGNPIGAFIASWDDSGLHNETFWLGWATGAQYAWTPGMPSVEQSVTEFMKIYYGPGVTRMTEIYRKLQEGARFWERSWDRVPSTERPVAYGNSRGKGIGGQRWDYSLTLPSLPQLPDLEMAASYRERYAARLQEAQEMLPQSDRLIYDIYQALNQADRNRYNLQVFLALARYQAHQLELLTGLARVEDLFVRARQAHSDANYAAAIEALQQAHGTLKNIIDDGEKTFANLKETFEISRYPKGRSVDGKQFLHIMDDVKDHWADRRPDLSFMMAPEERLSLNNYALKIENLIKAYQKERR